MRAKLVNEGLNESLNEGITQYRSKNGILEYKDRLFWNPVPIPYIDHFSGTRHNVEDVLNFGLSNDSYERKYFNTDISSVDIGDVKYNAKTFIKTFPDIREYLKLYKSIQNQNISDWEEKDKIERKHKKSLAKERNTPKYY